MAIETPGIKGELVWSDLYNSKVAYYPPECLPSSTTNYYSIFAYQPATQPYIGATVGTPFGAGLVAGLFPFGLIGGDVKTWTSTHRHIFAQCQYRVNYPLSVTREMIEAKEIELPEHVFEMLSVTKEKVPLPPRIQPVPEYTVDIHGLTKGSEFTINVSLVWETEVVWTLTYSWSRGSNNSTDSIPGFVSWTGSGIKIKPVDMGVGVLTATITASNTMGSHSKEIKVNIIDKDGTLQIQEGAFDEELPTKERLEDILWRQLFEQRESIPNNLFYNIIANPGSYYRMDNATSKAIDILKQPGSVTYGASSNDASSRRITLIAFDDIKENDTLYINCVAAKEHYLRQVATISWAAIDAGYLGFVAFPRTLTAANYRFYQWEVDDQSSPDKKKTLGGWRIVESFNYQPHVLGFISEGSPVLSDFIYGSNPAGHYSVPYLPPDLDYSKIVELMSSNLLPTYPMTAPLASDSNGYRAIAFPPANTDAPEWYLKSFANMDLTSYSNLVSHLVYNVHPDFLKWRDCDKYGYPIDLAERVQEALSEGQQSFLPTTPVPEYSTYITSENFTIEPIDSVPRIISLSNASKVSSPTGLFPGAGTGQVYGQFASNIIRESFKKGTKILVETRPVGSSGSVALTVECKGGGVGFVNCVRDPKYNNLLIFSNNVDGFLVLVKVQYGLLEEDSSKVIFDPLSGGIDYQDLNVNSVDVSKFDPVVGFSGLLGDSPGVQPGQVVSFYKYAEKDAFKEYYIGQPKTNILTKKVIGASTSSEKVIVQFGEFVYTGSFSIEVNIDIKIKAQNGNQNTISSALSGILKSSFETTALFASGNSVESSIDRIAVSMAIVDDVEYSTDLFGVLQYSARLKQTIAADYYWLKGESIIINFPWLSDLSSSLAEKKVNIQSIDTVPIVSQATIVGAKDDYAQDFLAKGSDVEEFEDGFKLWKGSLFAKADFACSHVDDRGNAYAIFPDQNGNLSCVVNSDNYITWSLQYALVPKAEYKNQDAELKYPFCLRSKMKQELFLFFVRNDVLYINVIPLDEIDFSEAFIIKDLPAPDAENPQPDDFFTRVRMSRAFVAAGNNDQSNLEFIQAYEKYSLGSETIFTNVKFTTPYFSAYQNAEGEIRLTFLDSSGKIQMHYSTDNGTSWNDLFVCMKYGLDGLVEDLGQFGKESSSYRLGFNPHSSTTDTEAESLYAYYGLYRKIRIFYVYKDCLLSKEVSDPVSCQEIAGRNNYDDFVSSVQATPAEFIDGNASKITDELGKTILMKHQYAVAEFGDLRTIEPQRVHATELSDGGIRIYYKTSENKIRSALHSGTDWQIDDMMQENTQ